MTWFLTSGEDSRGGSAVVHAREGGGREGGSEGAREGAREGACKREWERGKS